MKKTSKKNNTLVVLIVLLLALALGYAAFSATLNINGTATGTGTWDIHFQSAALLKADGTADTSHGTATVTAPDTITATVNLAYPGDGVLLEAVVVNAGTIPAKLTSLTINNACADLEITKAAGGPADNEDLAANGGTCTARYLVRWDPDSELTSLGSQTFTITYDYDQNTVTFNGTPSHSDAVGTN